MELTQILTLAEKGIALVALYMLYDICYNHLNAIENTLIEIKGLLDPDT